MNPAGGGRESGVAVPARNHQPGVPGSNLRWPAGRLPARRGRCIWPSRSVPPQVQTSRSEGEGRNLPRPGLNLPRRGWNSSREALNSPIGGRTRQGPAWKSPGEDSNCQREAPDRKVPGNGRAAASRGGGVAGSAGVGSTRDNWQGPAVAAGRACRARAPNRNCLELSVESHPTCPASTLGLVAFARGDAT